MGGREGEGEGGGEHCEGREQQGGGREEGKCDAKNSFVEPVSERTQVAAVYPSLSRSIVGLTTNLSWNSLSIPS